MQALELRSSTRALINYIYPPGDLWPNGLCITLTITVSLFWLPNCYGLVFLSKTLLPCCPKSLKFKWVTPRRPASQIKRIVKQQGSTLRLEVCFSIQEVSQYSGKLISNPHTRVFHFIEFERMTLRAGCGYI